ncbi:hypothetical protein [Flavobacterium sp. GP15]|uniref:hypothetical protein n=1 Tax=Flavobacterium sp. GP15 TaxID=2758567 RepID=UPI00165DDA99|nr:hypothetical protein [Flavobacterium sp. GP15]
MPTVISEINIKKSQKDYHCNGCETILEGGSFNQFCENVKLTFSEKRALVLAKENNYKIIKGNGYLKQFNKQDGETYVFRSIPEIHKICCKYDLYTDW